MRKNLMNCIYRQRDLSIPQMIKMAEDTNYLERLKVAKQ